MLTGNLELVKRRIVASLLKGRIRRVILITGVHQLLFLMSALAAFLLRFDFSIPSGQAPDFLVAIMFWLPLKMIAFRVARLDRTSWRFVSLHDVWRIIAAASIASSVSALAIITIVPWRFPRSLYVLDLIVSVTFVCGCRLLLRTLCEPPHLGRTGSQNALIYGAGEAGIGLLREVRHNPSLNYNVRGFIDDDASKHGTLLQGVSVLGGGVDLHQIASKRNISLVLIAIPSATGAQMAKILHYCSSSDLAFRTVPSIFEIVNNGSRPVLRDVAVEDLLCRIPVRLEHQLVASRLQGQIVLVTGAAGSIGSELCRQIARFRPKLLIGVDTAETALFYVEREMRESFKDVQFEPVIGSIQRCERIIQVFETYSPNIVFHAAAYKHVPMMEANVFEAVDNNVLGTFNVAHAARASGCDFVMISSDKAVRPTSIMGLTKRVAEMIVRSMPDGSGKFVSVRFGNVLDSNGSVVPIFRRQIAAGGPITITHPEMRRYFMTIPEAAQLVLQASAMGKGREIFVLEMGEQVKIVDLARSLVLLSGLKPDRDIRFEFTGIRPGEKLSEEISGRDEETLPTYHEQIRIFAGSDSIPNLDDWINDVRQLCENRDLAIIVRLKQLVFDYSPSSSILQALLAHDRPVRISAQPDRSRPNLQLSAVRS